jgi:hypothetical protein
MQKVMKNYLEKKKLNFFLFFEMMNAFKSARGKLCDLNVSDEKKRN